MNKFSTQLAKSRLTLRVWQTAIRKWSSTDESRNVVNITRIYNDKDGVSHFGTMEVELKGSGERTRPNTAKNTSI